MFLTSSRGRQPENLLTYLNSVRLKILLYIAVDLWVSRIQIETSQYFKIILVFGIQNRYISLFVHYLYYFPKTELVRGGGTRFSLGKICNSFSIKSPKMHSSTLIIMYVIRYLQDG
jgi:hypothetical protein